MLTFKALTPDLWHFSANIWVSFISASFRLFLSSPCARLEWHFFVMQCGEMLHAEKTQIPETFSSKVNCKSWRRHYEHLWTARNPELQISRQNSKSEHVRPALECGATLALPFLASFFRRQAAKPLTWPGLGAALGMPWPGVTWCWWAADATAAVDLSSGFKAAWSQCAPNRPPLRSVFWVWLIPSRNSCVPFAKVAKEAGAAHWHLNQMQPQSVCVLHWKTQVGPSLFGLRGLQSIKRLRGKVCEMLPNSCYKALAV